MGKLIINNTNWENTKNVNNTKHEGNGVATKSIDRILPIIKPLIESFLEEKYKCFKDQLANESNRKPSVTDGPNEGEATIGTRIGPGIIGENVNGNSPGYAGNTNLFVGVPDKEATNISVEIEKTKRINTPQDTCDA